MVCTVSLAKAEGLGGKIRKLQVFLLALLSQIGFFFQAIAYY